MKIDTIYFGNSSEGCFNLTGAVGHMGANLFDDVMLIQAMLALIGKWQPQAIGLGDEYAVPKATGVMDNETFSAIGAFQLTCKSQLIGPFDGRVDPAHYKGRRLRKGPHRVMSITLLHYYSTDAAVMLSESEDSLVSYQRALEKMNPQLQTIFDIALINS
jgi:hypothetical protein